MPSLTGQKSEPYFQWNFTKKLEFILLNLDVNLWQFTTVKVIIHVDVKVCHLAGTDRHQYIRTGNRYAYIQIEWLKERGRIRGSENEREKTMKRWKRKTSWCFGLTELAKRDGNTALSTIYCTFMLDTEMVLYSLLWNNRAFKLYLDENMNKRHLDHNFDSYD